MPYACQAGDDQPVTMHLQQLEDPYQSIDLCQDHWQEFVTATALAMGLVYPDESAVPQPPAVRDPEPAPGAPQEAEDAPRPAGGDSDPGTALTDDQRPAEAEPAPY